MNRVGESVRFSISVPQSNEIAYPDSKEVVDKLSNTEKSLAEWQEVAYNQQKEAEYYRRQLVDAHALLGRVIHQYSLLWDSVNLGEDFPTDNPYHRRNLENPTGAIKHDWEDSSE